jgi:fumarate hydratase class II
LLQTTKKVAKVSYWIYIRGEGVFMNKVRIERDSMGEMEVPEDKYWGAQTARSLINFSVGTEIMPIEVIRAFGVLKKAACEVNTKLGLLDPSLSQWIIQACEEVINGNLDAHFPLRVWQTGSGTQTNMNVNEVIANRANELAGKGLGAKSFIHPNDHVNKSQSSNDTFPTAMHIASVDVIKNLLLPQLKNFRDALAEKEKAYSSVIKIGRTHMMDAVPLTLGQEFSGYRAQIEQGIDSLELTLPALYELALGATAVGTGLNAPKEFAEAVSGRIADLTGLPFISAANKFAALSGHEPLVRCSNSLKTLAVSLNKIASDLRLMGSGPRCGISELLLPENEPGSSIMPGKVNPTQCEMLTQVAIQVIANDLAISLGASQGQFELNVYKPLIIYNLLQSIRLLADGLCAFREKLLEGLEINREKIASYVENSLMLITLLSPKLGYDKCAEIAHLAHRKKLSLKEAAMELNYISEKEFTELVRPENMI